MVIGGLIVWVAFVLLLPFEVYDDCYVDCFVMCDLCLLMSGLCCVNFVFGWYFDLCLWWAFYFIDLNL